MKPSQSLERIGLAITVVYASARSLARSFAHSFVYAKRTVVAILVAALGFASSPPAQAQQTCGLPSRTAFAGHAFPLSGNLVEPDLGAEDVFDASAIAGLSNTTFLAAPPDGSNRLFFSSLTGEIQAIPNDSNAVASDLVTVLDLSARVESGGAEEGLFSFAFHPDFVQNGYFYVYYTSVANECANSDRCARVVRYQVPSETPNTADPGSAFVVLEIDRPGTTEFHNGGMVAFGGDGFLYISVGDQNIRSLSQDLTSLRGKLLRIDVDSGSEFSPGIPEDNPFDNEVWLYGLRNPFRFSFDRENPNDLFIADVGEDTREEVTWLPAGSGGGHNLGWPDCEGDVDRMGDGCVPEMREPDLLYTTRPSFKAVTGGYVYRGTIPALNGHYVFADLNGTFFTWDRTTRDPMTGFGVVETLSNIGISRPVSFGEDESGELYAWSIVTPLIKRFRDGGGAQPGNFPTELSQTGLFTNVATLTPAPGLIEYEVASPLWSDGAEKKRWIALPDTETIRFEADEAWRFPTGSVAVKHFELDRVGQAPFRLETRVLLRQTDRWIGFTYRWNEAQTDATLLLDGFREDIDLGSGPGREWVYPSPTDCLRCHSAPAGRVLGLRASQLNIDFDYSTTSGPGIDNQLHAWNCVDLYDTDIGPPTAFDRLVPLEDDTASVATRARDYLQSNCAHCHQPGTAVTNLDLRRTTPLADANFIEHPPVRGDLGLAAPFLVDPGSSANSILAERVSRLDEVVRMPAGTLVPDAAAVSVLDDWINTVLFDVGSGTARLDSDEDGVLDSIDNCVLVSNPTQSNADADATGDACDPDLMPDLEPTNSLPSDVAAGQTFVASPQFINNTTNASVLASQLRVYLSLDPNLDDADWSIADCFAPTAPGLTTSGCSDATAQVPAELSDATGDYHWIVCADALDRISESDESNNCQVEAVNVPEPSAWMATLVSLATAGLVVVVRRFSIL